MQVCFLVIFKLPSWHTKHHPFQPESPPYSAHCSSTYTMAGATMGLLEGSQWPHYSRLSYASMTLSNVFFPFLPTWKASFRLLPRTSLLFIAICNLLSSVTELIAPSFVFLPLASSNAVISHIPLYCNFTWEWSSYFREVLKKLTVHSAHVEGSAICLGKWTSEIRDPSS